MSRGVVLRELLGQRAVLAPHLVAEGDQAFAGRVENGTFGPEPIRILRQALDGFSVHVPRSVPPPPRRGATLGQPAHAQPKKSRAHTNVPTPAAAAAARSFSESPT